MGGRDWGVLGSRGLYYHEIFLCLVIKEKYMPSIICQQFKQGFVVSAGIVPIVLWLNLFIPLATQAIVRGIEPVAVEQISGQQPRLDARVRVARFDVDATPPTGEAMAYERSIRDADLPLRCRGVVLLGAGEPIVLCAIDWIGVANEGHDAFRLAMAEAAGTRPDRVAVHAVHQHDAPFCDFTAERILRDMGVKDFPVFDGDFHREVIKRASAAIRKALPEARPATHWGFGRARVEEVASNRRIMGDDGKVRAVRYSTTREAALQNEPEGVIDPFVTALSFWNEDVPLAVMTAYACHPQSYYHTRVPSPDFPGIARLIRSQDVPEALHVHFNGAGGNVTAGKYNDGSPANRVRLATRLASGMRQAFDSTVKSPLAASDVGWSAAEVLLEPASHLDAQLLAAQIQTPTGPSSSRAIDRLAWLERAGSGHPILVTCLRVGQARMLHLPGELFVEYQLAAQKMRPDLNVLMAAYGDYGPAYIGTAVAYDEGGYEMQQTSSFVGPKVEKQLLDTIRSLLEETQ